MSATVAGESRGELLAWINDLLQINVPKVEGVGSGAVLCQIMDSVYGDVQMHKVKFNASHEYEYVQNFKVLQACFTLHGIDKFIPVDRLVKLKFQDNLEFLQWVKRFWDLNYPGGTYDAISRRKGTSNVVAPVDAPVVKSVRPAPVMTTSSRPASLATSTPSSTINMNNNIRSMAPAVRVNNTSGTPPATPSTQSQMQSAIHTLNKSVAELRLTLDEVERERDFYFNKLREVEIATQNVTDSQILESSLFKHVTEILYKTEEGFEIPE